MRRRDFMKIIGGAAAWPPFAHAQPSTTPVIGFLHSASPQPFAPLVAAFREGLSEGPAGYVEGRDIKIEYRWAEGRGGSAGHVGGRSGGSTGGLIVALGGMRSALAAKAATATIPILFIAGSDPIRAASCLAS